MNMSLRKLVVAASLAVICLPAVARERDGAKSEFSLPKAGDFSIGIDVTPVLNYIGNAFNGTENQSIGDLVGTPLTISEYSSLTTPSVSLLGRYMLKDNVAVRANFGLIVDQSSEITYVADDEAVASNSFSEAEVTDTKSVTTSGASIALGLEYRVGKGRIQGVFSGNLVYMYSVESSSYSYGNAITSINQTPTTAYSSNALSEVSYLSNTRELSQKGGGTNTIGLMATAGVEWFVASRISLGFEIDLLCAYSATGQSTNEYEGYNSLIGDVDNYTDLSSNKSKAFYLGTGCFGSNLTMNFYF